MARSTNGVAIFMEILAVERDLRARAKCVPKPASTLLPVRL